MAHERVRGTMGSCVQLMVVTGIMGAYLAGMPVAVQFYNLQEFISSWFLIS